MAAISKKSEDQDSDIVWGAEAIGRVINKPARQAFYLLENGHLPAKKTGGSWSASRRRLIAEVTGEATE
jgi:hypothetical protein